MSRHSASTSHFNESLTDEVDEVVEIDLSSDIPTLPLHQQGDDNPNPAAATDAKPLTTGVIEVNGSSGVDNSNGGGGAREATTSKGLVKPYFELLKRNRNYRILFIANIISELGNWFSLVATWSILHSAWGSAMAIAFNSVSLLFDSPPLWATLVPLSRVSTLFLSSCLPVFLLSFFFLSFLFLLFLLHFPDSFCAPTTLLWHGDRAVP